MFLVNFVYLIYFDKSFFLQKKMKSVKKAASKKIIELDKSINLDIYCWI